MLLQQIFRKQFYPFFFEKNFVKVFFRGYCQIFRPKRILAVSKISSYDFWKHYNPELGHEKLMEKLQSMGIDYDKLLASHQRLRLCEDQLKKVLKNLRISLKLTKKITDASQYVDWADLIVPIGGHGTFLLTSKMITNNTKPMMGINPNPKEYSNLTLPYRYSSDITSIFDMLLSGEYTVLMRSRIRTMIHGEKIYSQPFYVHEKGRIQAERRIDALIRWVESRIADGLQRRIRVLPWLALNEVFMAEFMAAKTSTMSFQADGKTECKFRSSGICVCTGTGSYSWYRSMNYRGKDAIQSVVSLATGEYIDDTKIDEIVSKLNNKISFNPEDHRMSYMIREMYRASSWPKPKNCPVRMMCNELKVKSFGFDAGLIIDGSISLPFNDGTTALFEIYPEDALKTIQLK